VDIVALEMMVLRVLSAEKSGKNSLDIAGLLKIKGSEIQQRYAELMMLAAGPFALPFIEEAMEAGWQGDLPQGRWGLPRRRHRQCAAGIHLLQPAQDHHLRRLQRSATQHRGSDCSRLTPKTVRALHDRTAPPETTGTRRWISIFLTTRNNCATPCASGWTRATPSSAAAPPWPPVALTAPPGTNWPSWA
jgi:hypothetical protein